jgi:Carboxypeptidase regulatory-like domain
MNRAIRYLGAAVLVGLGILLWNAGVASAQTFRGTILGTVTDSSGAAVAGATTIIKNLDTGLTRTVNTSDDGSYSAPELPIGNYSVTVQAQGFK